MELDADNRTVDWTHVNRMADGFEDAWLAGQRPSLADYMDQKLNPKSRAELFTALLELEHHYCEKKSVPFDLVGLSAEFNEYAGLIETIARSNSDTAVADLQPTALRDESRKTMAAALKEDRAFTASHAAEFQAGERLGRYEILETLGIGAMGEVYLARDTRLGRKVALKIPRLSTCLPETVTRFLREAKMAAALRHPNICQIYDVSIEEGYHTISMVHIEGVCLSEYMRENGPLEEADVVRILHKLTLALGESHRQGVVHRDLKPANVMLDEIGEPILTDFGLAIQMSAPELTQLTQSGMIVGSPAFMSPEQIRSAASVGPATDVYSLGIMMYQMLTGFLPFRGSLLEVLDDIARKEPERPTKFRQDLSPELEAICLKAIKKDAGQRYASMAEFSAVLENLKNSSVRHANERLIPSAQPEPVMSTTGTGNRRRGGWAFLTAIGLLSPIVVLGILFWISTENGGLMRVQIDDPSLQVVMSTDGLTINQENDSQAIKVKSGVGQTLKVLRGDFAFETDSFILKDGETTRIKIDYVDGKVVAERDGEKWQVFGADPEIPQIAGKPTSTDTLDHDVPLDDLPLEDEALRKLNRLVKAGVILRKTQDEILASPITQRPRGLFVIDLTDFGPVSDQDLAFLLSVISDCRRLIVNTDALTDTGWRNLAVNYFPELSLLGNSPSREAWNHIGSMRNLSQLSLRYSGMTDADLEVLKGLVNLEYLELASPSVDGSCFVWFGALQKLLNLEMRGTAVTDQNLGLLSQLRSLRILGLAGTNIDGSGLLRLSGLSGVNLRDCKRFEDLDFLSPHPIESLDLTGTGVKDVSTLEQVPVSFLGLDYIPERDLESLRQISTLKSINGLPASDFLEGDAATESERKF